LLETARFNLLDLGFGEINLVSFSRDGTIWVFDDHAQRLFKVNLQGDILLTSEDLRLVFDERITPTKMSESAGNLYLSVPGRGILIFDLFGQYTTQILEPGVSEFQILDEHMLAYQIDDTLAIHRIDRFERNDYLVPQKMTDAKVLLTKEKLILIRKNKIERMPLDVLLGNK
ncbi:MAG: hypothetical protein HKN76_06855, partial [Saprospiraceae bacterium]|nr:hypothetical protein [Saprospiraceae bacterium]